MMVSTTVKTHVHVVIQIWYCQSILKGKRPHFQLMYIAQIYLLLKPTILSFPGLITCPKHWNINLLFFFQSLYFFFQFTVYLLLEVNMVAIIILQSLSTYHSLDFCKNCWTLQKQGSTSGKLNAHSDKKMMLMRTSNYFICGMQDKWETLLTTQITAWHTYMFVNYTINFLNDVKINLQGIELL